MCLTDKTNFIEFRKHSGMVNTKFKLLIWVLGAGTFGSVTNFVNAVFEGLIAISKKIKSLLCVVTSTIKLL